MDKVQYAIEIVNKWEQPLAMFESKVNSVGSKKVDPFSNSTASLHKGNSALKETTNNLDLITAKQSAAIDKTMNWGTAIKAVAGSYLAMQVGGAVWNWTQDAVMAAAQVEKYNITLKTMLGSTGAARDRMQEYFDIAKKTPFQLNEVVEAGNKLQAIGRYSAENLTNLGDLAAASGKPMEQVMSAYSKLATGQKGEAVNMFRDLLISTEDWTKATGKGINKQGELLATTEEMIAALPGILKAKGFLGMMEQQSKSTEGKMSNLKDTIFQLSEAMGNRLKPTTDSYLDTANKMVDTIKEWVEIPTPVKIAQEKAELNALVGVITDANTGELERSEMLHQLQQQYPEFLNNLDLENVKNEELIARLKEVNKQYEAKMKVAGLQNRVSAAEEKYNDILKDVIAEETVKWSREEAERLVPKIKEYEKKGYVEAAYSTKTNDPIEWAAYVNRDLKKYYQGKKTLPADVLADMENFVAAVDNMQKESSMWRDDLGYLQGQLDAQYRIVQNEKARLNQAERNTLLLDAQAKDLLNETTYEQLFGSPDLPASGTLKGEFEGIRSKTSDEITELEWTRLYDFMQGNLAARSTMGGGGGTGGGSTAAELQKAEDLINGSGRNTKIYNIYLDSLIASNTNVFEPGQDPASAEEFLMKLTNALQLVVNDTQMSE